jgi:hypothetical protein
VRNWAYNKQSTKEFAALFVKRSHSLRAFMWGGSNGCPSLPSSVCKFSSIFSYFSNVFLSYALVDNKHCCLSLVVLMDNAVGILERKIE